MSKKHLVLVLTEPTEGQSEAFDHYYEHQHIDEVLATTGWVSGQRFKLADQVGASCPLPYLALYEAHADDPGYRSEPERHARRAPHWPERWTLCTDGLGD